MSEFTTNNPRASEALLGQQVVITVMNPLTGQPEPIGEFDKADWKVNDEIKSRKPLGYKLRRNRLVVHGYEGSLERGKIDTEMLRLMVRQWASALSGEPQLYFAISITNQFYDGSDETHAFRNVILHDFNWQSGGADEFVDEKLKFTAEDYELVTEG